jgi:membrane fusion protein (multidrug efflux system)
MKRKTTILLIGGIAAWAAVAVLVDRALAGGGRLQRTDDAYITADFSIVAPKVSGLIDAVNVDDNQRVRAGQELAHIDDRDYRTAVSNAEAELARAQADVEILSGQLVRQQAVIDQAGATVHSDDAALTFAQANATRYRNLSNGGAGTVEQQQQSASQLQQAIAAKNRDTAAATAAEREVAILTAQRDRAAADVKAAESALAQAQLNLSYTHILAPVDGVVGERSVRVGNYVGPGTALLAVVPLDSAYVLANFQETQLTDIKRGQPARITVDTFPGQTLDGTVDSLAPASGVTFSPLPPDNATGNFTKVVQRIAVKIRFNRGQPLLKRLRVGLSVEAAVDIGGTPPDQEAGAAAAPEPETGR